MDRSVVVILSIVTVVAIIGGAYTVGKPDTETCREINERLAQRALGHAPEPLSDIEERLGLDQQTLPISDLSGSDTLLVDLWERSKERRERAAHVHALLEDHEQRESERNQRFELWESKAQTRQSELDLKIQHLRLAQQSGQTGLTGQEARAKLLGYAVQRQEIEVERARQQAMLSRHRVADLDKLTPQLEAAQEELRQMDQVIAAKSQEQLEREREQACGWFRG